MISCGSNIESKMERMNINQDNDINDDNINYKELYLKEKKENKQLSLELENCKQDRDKWRSNYRTLFTKMNNLLLNQ